MTGTDQRADAHGFDFLFGSWRIENRRRTGLLAETTEWETFTAHGTCRPILGGIGNIEDFRPDWPARPGFEGGAVRIYDPEREEWSIHWFDNVRCAVFPPMVGRFQDGVGEFFGDDVADGRPVRVRFRWSPVSDSRAEWEQAISTDGGESWDTDWTMSFSRTG